MPEITIKIKQANETALSVTVDTEETVLTLKQKIEAQASVPPAQQRLIYAGKVLKDDDKLSQYKMAEGNTVHMVKGSTAPRTTPAASASPAASTPGATPSAGAPPAANSFWSDVGGAGAGAGAAAGNPFAALGGGGAPGGFGGMGGGMGMDPNMLSALMSNPAVSASISQMMANPQVLQQLSASNPQLAGMMNQPQVREMMQSDEFRRMMSDPNMLRSMMQMAPMMGAMGGGMGGMGGAGGDRAAAPQAQNPLAAMFGGAGAGSPTVSGMPPMMNPAMMQMLMGMGGMPGAAPAGPPDTRPPEERFQVQLGQLQEMGFFDATENVRALTRTHGNVEAAVELLFSSPPGTL
ncbi:ubiquitin-like polyubiquitin-binding protein [Powellomyces hirtus]|nr:ubiquitin-like polyubiquitin-binding protein [Powellomyces hirtus]